MFDSDTFWRTVCDSRRSWRNLLAMALGFLIMLGLAFRAIEPGSASWYVGLVTAGMLLFLVANILIMTMICRRKFPRRV